MSSNFYLFNVNNLLLLSILCINIIIIILGMKTNNINSLVVLESNILQLKDFIKKVVTKLTWGLVIAFIINLVFQVNLSPILLDTDSDSESDSDTKGKGIADPHAIEDEPKKSAYLIVQEEKESEKIASGKREIKRPRSRIRHGEAVKAAVSPV
jgi:hypothetical protein